jgi:beta-xylosidase
VLALTLTACAPASTPTDHAPRTTIPPTATEHAPRNTNPAPRTTDLPPRARPVLDHDFPDPDVLQVGEDYYAYATNTAGVNVQVARSPDLVTWDLLGEALPTLPAWADQDFGHTWAPEVTTAPGGGSYLMYFTTRFALDAGGTQCIGVARASEPTGPFVPVGDAPIVCPVGQGGAIDAATFTDDDGARYLLWKVDGNSQGGTTPIFLQLLSADGLALAGEAVQILAPDQRWEGAVVEGPTLWKQDGRYYLLYSANRYATPDYAVGVAVAEAVLGPYEKLAGPLLDTDLRLGLVGPGGQDVVRGPEGETWLLFHAWTPAGIRALYLAELLWIDGAPVAEPVLFPAAP